MEKCKHFGTALLIGLIVLGTSDACFAGKKMECHCYNVEHNFMNTGTDAMVDELALGCIGQDADCKRVCHDEERRSYYYVYDRC